MILGPTKKSTHLESSNLDKIHLSYGHLHVLGPCSTLGVLSLDGGASTGESSVMIDDGRSGGFIGLFRRPVSYCTILCACPLNVEIFCVFCALFRLSNAGRGYNDILSLEIVILYAPNLPSDSMPLWGGLALSSTLYHYGFGVQTASLLLRGCCLQLGEGK